MSIQLPYGIQNGSLTHISDVISGLECGCVCPACDQQLVARKGKKTVHHFAHYQTNNCKSATETALHLAAKQILENEKRVRLPDTQVQFNSFREPFTLYQSTSLEFENVRLETTVNDVIPDILIQKNDRQLAIEIKVSHEVDEEKKKKVSRRHLSVLEIDLTDLNRDLTPEVLKSVVIDQTKYKKWIYNHRAQLYHDRLMQVSQRKMIQETGMDMFVNDCPKEYRANGSTHYALVVDDCWHCRHCVHHDREEGFIYCSGSTPGLPH